MFHKQTPHKYLLNEEIPGMNNPKISVIVPNYCHAKYLDQRLQSIVAQTYQNFELIILDDCSPDDGASRSVIERYRKHHHISHIVYNEQNSGSTFKQWQKGISLAKGEYIWIAESDDFCAPNLLEALVKETVMHPNVVLASCRNKIVNEEGQVWLQDAESDKVEFMDGKAFINKYLIDRGFIANAGQCIFSRMSALQIDKQYADPKYGGVGDRMFYTEIAETGNVVSIFKALNCFRRHEGTVTSTKETKGLNSIGRHHVLLYQRAKGYVPFYKYYDACVKEQHALTIDTNIPEGIKLELRKLWRINALQRLVWRIIYSAKYRLGL